MSDVSEYHADKTPLAYAYEKESDMLLAELYTESAVSDCKEASWIRVESE